MKKLFISAVVMIGGSLAVQAQVKYGDNPATVNPGSLLELESANKGFLPPRVALTDRLVWGLNGSTPANGMIVYNTATGLNSLDTGLVVWQGKWNQLSTQQTADFWRLNGNAGTIKGANFVGTADNADLVFKTNGQYRMHLDSLGGMWLGDSSLVYNGSFGNTFSGFFSSFYNKDQGTLTGPAGSVSGRMAHKLSATSPYLAGSLYGVHANLNLSADNGTNRAFGDAAALKIVATRGAFNGDADGSGYIESLNGSVVFAGNNSTAAGTTNKVFGVEVVPTNHSTTGVINNYYGYYMDPKNGVGTITNKYGVYINNDFINYFGGKVGIGTAAGVAANQLHVSAAANPVRFEGLQPGAATDNIVTVDANGVLTKSTATLSAADLTSDAWVNNAANTRVELGTQSDGTTARATGNEFVALDNGNVGIGLTAPSAKLEVADNTGTNDANPVVLISASGANNRAIATIQSFQSPQTTPNYLFQTNYTDATGATVGPQHNFSQFRGIGTPTSWTHSPLLAGDVLGSIAMIGSNANNNSTNGAHIWAYTPDGTKTILSLGTRNLTTNGGGRSQALNIVSNGTGGLEANIGINTTTPTNKLHVTATANPVRFEGLQPAAATDNIVTVDANGVLTKSTGTLSAADLTSDAWVNNAANTRVELGTNSDGTTARTAGTEMAVTDNGAVLQADYSSWLASLGAGNVAYNVSNVSSSILPTVAAGKGLFLNNYNLSVQNGYSPNSSVTSVNASVNVVPGNTTNYSFTRGILTDNQFAGSGAVSNIWGSVSRASSQNGTATNLIAVEGLARAWQTGVATNGYAVKAIVTSAGTASLSNGYAFHGSYTKDATATLNNAYGFYMDNVNLGTNSNYSIYTNAGRVRFGDLPAAAATDNIVTVDANGVLTKSTGTLSAADLTSDAWVNNAANSRVELGTKSDGTTARPAGTEFVATDNGRVGIGTTTLDFAKLDSRETLTADATGLSGTNYIASNGSLFLNHSAATSNQTYRGMNGSVTTLPANTTSYTNRLYGASTSVNHQGSGTVAQATGFYGATFQNNVSGVITNNNGIQAEVRVDAGLSNNIQGLYSYVSTQPSSTIKQPSVVAVRGAIDALGAGMANAYSFSATVSSLTNVDNYYSYFIPVTTETITSTGNKYAFYNNADIKSWFKGNLGLGTAAGTANARLHVVKAAADLTPAIIEGCQDYADNAAAIAAGLPIGAIYRTGDVMKVVH